MKLALFFALLSLTPHVSQAALPVGGIKQKPKLVLLLAIDQFRADYLTRFTSKFLPPKTATGHGGFRMLMEKGAYFPFAQYGVLQAMTGPGHAAMLSGSHPYQMGIPLNEWFDVETNEEVYCAGDKSVALVPASDVLSGTSPKNMRGDTVGDALKNTGYSSKVVSIALKDRAAIFMGGHRADLALWFESKSFQWVSSRHYLPEGKLPGWVTEVNAQVAKQPNQTKGFLATAGGNDLTLALALKAITEMKLGHSAHPDLLALSLSSHDYMGHDHGPNSPLMEAMTISEDKLVASLFNVLEKKIPGGMKNVLVVLTADHGVAPHPDLLKPKVAAGYVDLEKVHVDLEAVLKEKWGSPAGEKWIPYVEDFNFWIDPKSVEKHGVAAEAVQSEIKSWLLKQTWVSYVFTQAEFTARRLPAGKLEKQILATYFPGRSGQVVAIPRPYFMQKGSVVTHVTGYPYDSSVPLIFMGPGVKAGTHSGGEVIDIAPTLSFMLGVVAPALSEGRVLSELF